MTVEWTVGGVTAAHATVEESVLTSRGETVSVAFAFAQQADYESIRDYLIVPGQNAVRTGVSDQGIPWFRERVPAGSLVSSYLVEVAPGSAVPNTPAFWALIVGGDDQTSPPSRYYDLELQLFVVALSSNYPTESDVRNEFEDER